MVKKRRQKIHTANAYLTNDLGTRLVEMTVPLFIFAATACRFIEDHCNTGTPTDKLEKILKQRPWDHEPQITATYLPVV